MVLIKKIISIFGYLLYVLRYGLLNITHLGKICGLNGKPCWKEGQPSSNSKIGDTSGINPSPDLKLR